MAENNNKQSQTFPKQNQTTGEETELEMARPKSLLHKIWKFTYRKLPYILPDPDYKRVLSI